MEGFEARLAKVELAIVDGEEKFEEVGRNMEEFHEEVLTAINRVLAQCQDRVDSMEESHRAEVSSLQVELKEVLLRLERTEEELALCKRALAHDVPSTSEVKTKRIDPNRSMVQADLEDRPNKEYGTGRPEGLARKKEYDPGIVEEHSTMGWSFPTHMRM